MFLNVPRDPYCYQCHLKIAEIKCLNCWRNYCEKCIKKGTVKIVSNSLKKCPSCVQLLSSIERWESGIAFRPLDREAINRLFTDLIESVKFVSCC